jgi:hypothetical protein
MGHSSFVRQRILQTLKTFNWQQWLVAMMFLLALGFTGLHAARTIRDAIYWHYHQDEPIRGWMTVGYAAHSYHLPPHILYQALGLPHKPPDKRPLREIAKSQNRSMNEIRVILQDAIAHARPPYPPPPPPPPPPDEGGTP